MAAEGVPFPWWWNGGRISTVLDVIWEMSAQMAKLIRSCDHRWKAGAMGFEDYK